MLAGPAALPAITSQRRIVSRLKSFVSYNRARKTSRDVASDAKRSGVRGGKPWERLVYRRRSGEPRSAGVRRSGGNGGLRN